MKNLNPENLRIKIELLEKLISKKELRIISVSKRLIRIRKQLNCLLAFN